MSFKERLREIKQEQIRSKPTVPPKIVKPSRKEDAPSYPYELRETLKRKANDNLKPILKNFRNAYVGDGLFRSKIETFVTSSSDIKSGRVKHPKARLSLRWGRHDRGRKGNALHLALSDEMSIYVGAGHSLTLVGVVEPVTSLNDEGWASEVESKILDFAKTPGIFEFDYTPKKITRTPDFPDGEMSGTADLP